MNERRREGEGEGEERGGLKKHKRTHIAGAGGHAVATAREEIESLLYAVLVRDALRDMRHVPPPPL